MEETKDPWQRLREPFPPERILKLPAWEAVGVIFCGGVGTFVAGAARREL
jgi:hypothetical protein